MVYVLNKEGQPLMPTNRHGKVKHLLKEGKAIIVKRYPFTKKQIKEASIFKYEEELISYKN